jgi:hypothetical protein
MRMANGDNGFSSKLETFGRYRLPLSSESYFEESWHEFCLGTLELCENFAKEVSMYAIAGYVVMFCLLASRKPHRLPCVGRGVRRLAMICEQLLFCILAAKRHV